MIVCIAKNYQEFEKWRDERVVYVGDKRELELLDPSDVRDIRFVGEHFRDHPLYFSDELLEFQINVTLAKRGDNERIHLRNSKKKSLFRRTWEWLNEN